MATLRIDKNKRLKASSAGDNMRSGGQQLLLAPLGDNADDLQTEPHDESG
jgi:hypothetical protein